MLTTVKYLLLTALRDRLFIMLLAVVCVSTFLSSLLGSTALIEVEEMIVVYAAGAARLVLVVGLIVFVCFHVRHAFDSREIEVMLSRPVSRLSLVLAYWVGFAAVSLLLVAPTAGIIAWLGYMDNAGFIAWALSLLLECWLASAIAIFAALMLKSAVSAVMGSFALYVMGRMMGYFIATSKSGLLFREEWLNEVGRWSLTLISAVTPRLDFFAHTDWLVYGIPAREDWSHFLLQAALFIPIVLTLAAVDFLRKEF